MKKNQLLSALLLGQLLFVQTLFATDIPEQAKSHFLNAKEELVNMLEGKTPLSYEQAIFTIENAYWENQVDAPSFNYQIEQHVKNIEQIIDINRDYSNQNFTRTLLETEEQKKAKYERALTNWAIFSYMTDTTLVLQHNKILYNLPLTYSNNDPLGTLDWSNTQVLNLLDTKKGNCFALVSVFKIFSERLNSEAIVCTAPGHIYIRHADHKGIYHNVELASKAFPGTGSMETLTYTTDEALKSGISLRELDLKQSVALSLVYLAKGYEYKFNTRTDNFILECAELALKYDSLNLNAMLLKAEVLEEKLIAKNKTLAQLKTDKDFIQYEKFINKLFALGYREMPMEMKNLVISRLRNEESTLPLKDHTPKPNEHLGVKNDRYYTLSGGLFDEMMLTKPIEQYHRTKFDTKKKKISAFVKLDTTYNKYPIDLVVFAWSIDPLASKYPFISPYAAFGNNPIMYVDKDGREPRVYVETKGTGHTFLTIKNGNDVIVYTYGRYAGGDALTGGATGAGVLVRYTGEKAKDFIKTELYRMDAKAYEIKDVSDSKIQSVMDKIYNNSTTKPKTGNEDVDNYGKVIDNYNLFDNNCTTSTIDGVTKGGSNVFKDDSFVIPSSLNEFLQTGDVKNVKDVTGTMKGTYQNTTNKKSLGSAGSSGTSSGLSGESSGSSANSSNSSSDKK